MSEMTDIDKGYVDLILAAAAGEDYAPELLSLIERGLVKGDGYSENGGAVVALTEEGQMAAKKLVGE